MFEGESGAEFVQFFAGFEFATEEGLHFEFEFGFADAGGFEFVGGELGGFAVLLDLGFGGGDALLDLLGVPLDAFEFGGGLLEGALDDGEFALDLGEGFAGALALVADGVFLVLGVFELGAEGEEGFFFFFFLGDEAFEFDAEAADFGFAAEGGDAFFSGGAAVDDAVGCDEVATEGGDGEVRELAFDAQSGVQVFGDEDIAEEAVDGALGIGFGADFVEGPGDAAFGEELGFGGDAEGAEVASDEGGFAEFFVGEDLDDVGGEFGLGEKDGLEVVSEGGFDGGDEAFFDVDGGGEEAADAGGVDVGVVEAFEDLLGALGEAFAFLEEGFEDFEAGAALGDGAFEFVEFGVEGIALAAAFDDLMGAGFEAFVEFVAGGFEVFDLLLKEVEFGLAAFARLSGLEAVVLEGVGALAVGGDLTGEALNAGFGGGDLAFELAEGFAGSAAVVVEAGAVGEDALVDGEVFVDGELASFEVAAEGEDLFVGEEEFLALGFEEALAGFDLFLVLADAAFEFFGAFAIEANAAFGALDLGAEFLGLGAELVDAGLDGVVGFAGDGGFLFGGAQAGLEFVELGGQGADVIFGLGFFAGEIGEVLVGEVGVEGAGVFEEGLVAAGFGGLALEGAHLAFHFGDDVGDAEEVGFGVVELAEGFFFLGFEFGDAGGFFEDSAAVFGLRGKEHVDLALGHDGVGGAADTGAGEEVVDVFEAADGAVDAVFGAAIPEDAAADGDFVVVDAEGLLAIGHGEDDFGHADGFAFVGAVEDDVGHFVATEGFGGGFAEDPADGVDDVGFAAAIGADDAGDAFVEVELGFVSEGLEAVDEEGLEVHGGAGKGIV